MGLTDPFTLSIVAIVALSLLGLPIGHSMIGGSILYLWLAGLDMGTAAEQLLNGLQLGLMLFLLAAGLTLVFGIMDMINLAHGSLYMIGAYIAAAVIQASGSFLLGVAGAAKDASSGILVEGSRTLPFPLRLREPATLVMEVENVSGGPATFSAALGPTSVESIVAAGERGHLGLPLPRGEGELRLAVSGEQQGLYLFGAPWIGPKTPPRRRRPSVVRSSFLPGASRRSSGACSTRFRRGREPRRFDASGRPTGTRLRRQRG